MRASRILTLFLILCPWPSVAAEASRAPWERDPVWLAKDALSIADALPPPPAPHSLRDDADFRELLASQARRSKRDCARAATEVSVSLASFDGPPYGPLSAAEVKAWSPFFEKIRVDAEFFVQRAKRQWNRPRPYAANPKIEPCLRRETTGAYPSGHAAISEVFALALSEVDPSRKPVFVARALQIGGDRILGGVHHPSDIEAGRKLGDEIFALLEKNPAFEQALRGLPTAALK